MYLVANKCDQVEERMVTPAEGQERGRELGCGHFREISLREQADAAHQVVEQLYVHWKRQHHPVRRLRRPFPRCLLACCFFLTAFRSALLKCTRLLRVRN